MTTSGLIFCLRQFCLLTKQLWYKSREYYETHFGKTKSTSTELLQPQTSLTAGTLGRPPGLASTIIHSIDFERNQLRLYMKQSQVLHFTFPQRQHSFITPFTSSHNSPSPIRLKIQVQCNKNKAFTMLSWLQPTYLNLLNRLVFQSPCSIGSLESLTPCKGTDNK